MVAREQPQALNLFLCQVSRMIEVVKTGNKCPGSKSHCPGPEKRSLLFTLQLSEPSRLKVIGDWNLYSGCGLSPHLCNYIDLSERGTARALGIHSIYKMDDLQICVLYQLCMSPWGRNCRSWCCSVTSYFLAMEKPCFESPPHMHACLCARTHSHMRKHTHTHK